MSDDEGNENGVPNALLGWLIAPLAVLVALLADKLADFGLGLGMDELTPFVAIIAAAVLGITPRVIRDSNISGVSSQTISLITLIVALFAAEGAAMYTESNLVGLLFFITMFGGHMLDIRGRHEWNTVLIFSMVGFLLALVAAGNFISTQTSDYVLDGETYSRIDAWREAIGFIFFNVWFMMIVLGLLAATLLRGHLAPATDKGWFGYIPDSASKWNSSTLPLQIALAIWAASHIAVITYFNSLGDIDVLAIWSEDGYHGYIGFWPAALTGVVALICAWMCAEHWYTRAMLVGSMWAIYIVASLYETGHWSSENFEGTWAVWIWFGITFFVGVVIYWFSTHDEYGGWMIREPHQPSQARVFWSNHWAGILTGLAFLVALAIRIQWYLVPSMNSAAIQSWDLTGGSDPWYMKRVVDYIIAEHAHLVFDADRNYPVGGINPRPPLFTWSIALGGMALAPLIGISTAEASWWSILALPAIFGALTIFPMSGIAKDNFGKGAGVIAAWLIAFMPTHVQKSTWAMADHDSFVLLFFTAAFMFYLRAVKAGGDERLLRNTNATPMGLIDSLTAVFQQRRAASLNAIAAGICFAIVALGWKGFVYGPAIIFLAYFVQVALNMFRRRDSTILSALNIFMLATIFVMVLPFYGHPQLDLVLNATGLQPLVFIGGFTIAITWITTGFRDKPWLLVLGSLVIGGVLFLGLLYTLQLLEISNAWNVLTTGSGYFTKNKIFGTIAEASAPSRGQLFASFGPFIFVIAIVMGVIALWDGLFKKNQNQLILGMWVIIAAYMAWSAGRFLFNAAPAMAVMGAWGIVTMWKASGAGKMVREWRRMGIRTPGERISSARKIVWRSPQFSAIGLVLLMLVSQHATYGIDAAMPSSGSHETDMDEIIYNIVPDLMRWNELGFSLLDDKAYEPGNSRWYLGSFGSGFNDQGWNLAYDWLADQDLDQSYSDRPAFVSWWDYGFQALESGDHPSVSDNFQSGIPATGNMLLARNQDDVVAMFVWRLSEADLKYSESNTGIREHTSSFMNTLEKHLTSQEHVDEFVTIQTDLTSSAVEDRVFTVIQVNRDTTLAKGYEMNNGLLENDDDKIYRVYESTILEPCVAPEQDFTSCNGDAFAEKNVANSTFNSFTRAAMDTEYNTTHYVIGDYWYTADLVEEFDSVSTAIHRANAGIALITQLLTNSLSSEEIHDLYSDLMDNAVYSVQDYDGGPGEMITRDHEIRYFAIDTRLYPRAGRYSDDYTGGNPTGIFAAPTILSGQDFSTFMVETYETTRGQFADEMTRDEYNEEMRKDIINQQAGSEVEPLTLVDVRIDHTPAFFDTMLARTYIGYGAPQLGFTSTEQPGQHFGQSGSPNSIMSNAVPLPGAMMNHFVIANWYDSENPDNMLGQANTLVKVLKYYPGTEVCGLVSMSDNGEPLPNVRMLLERDAFSGEDSTDLDDDTYWIPIGYTDADENGEWCYTIPAGRIRVSAYAGVYDDIAAKDVFRSGEYTSGLTDFTIPNNPLPDKDSRETNIITGLLGHVTNMTWLGESSWNITGAQADREEAFDGNFDITVASSGVSGTVTWSGDESFAGDPIENTTFILRNIWSMTDNYTVTTTSGSFTSDEFRIVGPGTGEVHFTEEGTFDSQGSMGLVQSFTGNYSRIIADGRTYTTNGSWTGAGSIVATWIDYDAPDCIVEVNETTIPIYVDDDGENQTHSACLTSDESNNTYLFQGTINASGRMTADGSVHLVKHLDDETFEGEGLFIGVGIANGTGLFSGIGEFSGEMVQPGSFYMSGLMPGTYNMIAQFPNGKEVLLPNPVEVHLTPSLNLAMTLGGSIFKDALFYDLMVNGEPVPLVNTTIELFDHDLSDADPIIIMTNETGNFSYGPITRGDYMWRVDADGDGWYERELNFSVGEDPENITIEFSIPTKRDITLTLDAGGSGLNMTGRTVKFTNVLSTDLNDYSVTSVSENGTVFAELDMGDWIISDEDDDEYILWSELEVRDVDVNQTISYAVSVWFNGTVYAPPQDVRDEFPSLELIPQDILDTHRANGVTIEATSGGIFFSDVSNNENSSTTELDKGTFSLRLPAGRVFHVNAESFATTGTVTAGMLIADAAELENETSIFLTQSSMIRGTIFLQDDFENGTLWGNGVPGSEDAEVIATSSTGIEWRYELTEEGDFVAHLSDGNWTFTVSNELMNVSAVTVNVSVSNNVILIANPEPVTIIFRVFLDTNEDGEWANGTHIQPEIRFVPQDDFGMQVNLTADDYNITSGELVVSLKVGQYLLEIDEEDPQDENASDYRIKANSLPGLDLGLSESGEPIEIVMDPYYLVTGTVNQENGYSLNFSTVYFTEFEDAIGSSTRNVTITNGSFATYLPQGKWLVQIKDYTSDSNQSEMYRGTITVDADSSNRTNMAPWTTLTAMVVNIHLSVEELGGNLSHTRVLATSLDGLGNKTLGPSDGEGKISELLMPGSWTLSVNRTDNMERWFYPIGIANSTDNMVDGIWEAGTLALTKTVKVGGKVFWDLDADERPDSGEGVENVTVSFIGGTVNETMLTDNQGNWNLWVPIRQNYTIEASKIGFANVSFVDEWVENETNFSNPFFQVNESHESRDITITAGNVLVDGQVTVEVSTDRVTQESLDGATVILYPAIGLEREVIVPSTFYDNGTLYWNASVEPGDWIVIVTASDITDNGGGVAIGLINASVQEGATLDLVMKFGGHILLTSSWTTFDDVVKHAGEVDGVTVEVEIDIGDDLKWIQTFDSETGELDITLPVGSLDFYSEFTIKQHEMQLEMEYVAGVGVDNVDGLDSKEVSFTRRTNSDLSSSIDSASVQNAVVAFEELDEIVKYNMSAIEDDSNGYRIISLTLDLTYEGTELIDIFTASGGLSPAQDSALWTVEFENSTGVWGESAEVTFGIGTNNSDSQQILNASVNARIILPLQNESYTLSNGVGHSVNLRLVPSGGSPHERTVRVFVPQQFNISLSDAPEKVGIADGEKQTVTFTVNNNGNGDDAMTITPELTENCVSAGWWADNESELSAVGPGIPTPAWVGVEAPENSTVSECTLTVTVDSGGETDSQTIEIEFVISVASLSFDPDGIEPREADAAANQAGLIRISVTNDGFLDAETVIVYIEGSGDTEFSAQKSLPVPAKSTVYFEFEYSGFNPQTQRFEIRMEAPGTPTDSSGDDHEAMFDIKFSNMAEGEESSSVVWVVVILSALILFGGYKVARKGSSSRF